jgi:hypothetical protein
MSAGLSLVRSRSQFQTCRPVWRSRISNSSPASRLSPTRFIGSPSLFPARPQSTSGCRVGHHHRQLGHRRRGGLQRQHPYGFLPLSQQWSWGRAGVPDGGQRARVLDLGLDARGVRRSSIHRLSPPGGARIEGRLTTPAPARVQNGLVLESPPAPAARSFHVFWRGWIISSGRTHVSNCSPMTKPSASAASRKLMSSRWALIAIWAAFS